VIGAEALVRWAHPRYGVVAPNDFLPLAEESGLIISIDRWVVREVTRTQERWAVEGLRPLRVAVNVSERTLREGDLANWVQGCLGTPAGRAENLEVEITERVAVDCGDAVKATIAELRSLGVRLAIDDFGTGTSSLARLSQWSFDTLKIDRAFVERIDHDPAPLAGTIVKLGHTLGVEVIGEGVETTAQADFLAEQGCHIVQGYLCSHPLDIEDFDTFVAASAGAGGKLGVRVEVG
jgi:EAL domain-containing protein (putative c-di-GMP-specific phosphodiesterase class I)